MGHSRWDRPLSAANTICTRAATVPSPLEAPRRPQTTGVGDVRIVRVAYTSPSIAGVADQGQVGSESGYSNLTTSPHSACDGTAIWSAALPMTTTAACSLGR